MTEPETEVALAGCWAKNRRPGRAAVHLVVPGSDHALCGVLTGEGADPGSVTCWTCRDTVTPASTAPSEAVLAAAADALNGPPLVHIQICHGQALVFSTYNVLVISVIRSMPGARWHKPSKAWVLPSDVLADELARRLAAAGVKVTSELLT